MEFAGKRGIKVHGHTLVWHEQLPKWVTEAKRTPQECRDLMLGHIEAVVGRWRGKILAWDVVNEAIEKDGTFRKTYWKDNVGQDYIDLAFRKAHEVDPKAKLVYNDYGIEGRGPKADAAYELVKGMKQRGVPIDAIGFQCHWEVGKHPAVEEIRANIKRFGDLGLEVWITELDLRVKMPATAEELAETGRGVCEPGADVRRDGDRAEHADVGDWMTGTRGCRTFSKATARRCCWIAISGRRRHTLRAWQALVKAN